jgi:hypothetical protein
MFEIQIVGKTRKHTVCSVTFFFENRAVYEIMWKNIVVRGRPQMTIWRMRIACWILKATNTYTQVVLYSLFFHSNNGCKNAPQCYVIRTLFILFIQRLSKVYSVGVNINSSKGLTCR